MTGLIMLLGYEELRHTAVWINESYNIFPQRQVCRSMKHLPLINELLDFKVMSIIFFYIRLVVKEIGRHVFLATG
jgi:hypothetical protein